MVQSTNSPAPAPPYTLEADLNSQSPADRLPFDESSTPTQNPQNVTQLFPAGNPGNQAQITDQNATRSQHQVPDLQQVSGKIPTEAPNYGPQVAYQEQSKPYEMDRMRETLPSQNPFGSGNNGSPYMSQTPRPIGSKVDSSPAQSWNGPSPHYAPPHSDYQNHTSKKPSGLLSKIGAGSSKKGIEEVYIAVMGVTGAGKSSFISLCTKKSVIIGHNLMSCTMEVEDFSFMWNSHIRVHLIDTPGFDDTKRKDTDVLRDIAGWMAVTYTNKIKLSGIIYLHRITDPRMGGTQMRNLTMFKELCGPKCFPAVTLATTFWGAIDPATGADREQQLISNDEFWGYMAKKGSQVVRHSGTRNSAMDIVGAVVKRQTKIVLDIQNDMVNKGLDLDETLAGQSLNRELIEQRKKHQQEMKILEADMRKAIAEKDEESVEAIAQMQKEFQDKINQGNKDVRDLQASLENLKEERDTEMKKIQEELAERAADYARREKEWQDYRDANSFDPEESERKEREMEVLRQQLKDLIEKGERKKTGVWYEIGEFFEETVDEIKTWWKNL